MWAPSPLSIALAMARTYVCPGRWASLSISFDAQKYPELSYVFF